MGVPSAISHDRCTSARDSRGQRRRPATYAAWTSLSQYLAVASAVAYREARGYPAMAIEKDDDGLIVLVFKPLPDVQMSGLIQALPVHLSAKIGTVSGDRPPFTPRLNA